MGEKSKPISRVDDEVESLIMEALEGNSTASFHLSRVYKIKNVYYVLEFLKCDTIKPNKSHPNIDWFKNSQRLVPLWDMIQKLKGCFFLINYEDTREQFKVIKVLELDDSGIKREESCKWSFYEFKRWFKSLNKRAMESSVI